MKRMAGGAHHHRWTRRAKRHGRSAWLASRIPVGVVEGRAAGAAFLGGEFQVSRFDEDTSMMRTRIAATPIELRKPESGPRPRARGILVGLLLGAATWAAIIALGVAIWRWLS